MSRPEIPINWDKVDELLMAGCYGTEVAAFLGMHEKTFYDRVLTKYGVNFTEYACQKKSTGDSLLRMQQYLKAMGISSKGDNTMLIFLGKQRLGQKENPNDKMAPEEVLKAFNDLMKQIDKAQESRKPWEKKEVESTATPQSLSTQGPPNTETVKQSAFY